jgi:hypothetical protein
MASNDPAQQSSLFWVGVGQILLAALMYSNPFLTLTLLTFLMAVTFMLLGCFEIYVAKPYRERVAGRRALMIIAAASSDACPCQQLDGSPLVCSWGQPRQYWGVCDMVLFVRKCCRTLESRYWSFANISMADSVSFCNMAPLIFDCNLETTLSIIASPSGASEGYSRSIHTSTSDCAAHDD